MGSYYKLNLEERKNLGTSSARGIRRNGGILVNYYYGGEENQHLVIDKNSFSQAINSGNRVFEMDSKGESVYVIIKDAQYHPVTEEILHIDLMRVRRDEKMKISIPIILEGNAIGAIEGGIVTQTLNSIDVECFPTNVPENLIVDITSLELNGSISAADIELPKDVSLDTLSDTTLVVCNTPKAEEEPEESLEEEMIGGDESDGSDQSEDENKDSEKNEEKSDNK